MALADLPYEDDEIRLVRIAGAATTWVKPFFKGIDISLLVGYSITGLKYATSFPAYLQGQPNYIFEGEESLFNSFLHLFVRSFIHLFACPFVHSLVHSFIHSFISPSFISPSFISSFVSCFIHLFVHSSYLFLASFIHLFVHSSH